MQTSPTSFTRAFAQTLTLSLAAGTLLTIAATSRADDTADLEKSAAFVAVLQGELAEVTEQCKLQLAVTTDIATADLSPWTDKPNGALPKRVLIAMAAPCSAAIEAIYSLCQDNANKAQWQQVIPRELKGIRCQFTGHQPKQKGEGNEVWMRRNITFANGVLTVLAAPVMYNPGDTASLVLMAGLAGRPGAPAVRKDILETGERGEACTSWKDCGTGLCANGVCAWCTSKAKCRAGASCDEGTCRSAEEMRGIEAQRAKNRDAWAAGRANNQGAKPAVKGSAKGRMCSKDKDCQSGACKMENKTRGRCQ